MNKLSITAGVLFQIVVSTGCNSPAVTTAKTNNIPETDTTIFNIVQQQTFNYFWDGAEPVSGLARERYHVDENYPQNDKHVVTSGGAGFGVMSIIVGIERGYITRDAGIARLEKIVSFLERADRFHGVWPHWWNGETGKVVPFSKKDNGGDIVETAYMLQGLLCVRQYLNESSGETSLKSRINKLWGEVEFDWYTQGKNVLYWHWSPDYNWEMNFAIRGYNECLIAYVLAASSPTHPVSEKVYHEGWAESGKISRKSKIFGYELQLRHQVDTAPLFWAHYSYLGLDPRGLKDRYADYWQENQNQTLINYTWCANNPKKFKGYGPDNWGLTSSYSISGYSGHAPSWDRDLGVISPTAALSSFPYTPEQSAAAMKHWYTTMNDKLWGPFGFYDAFSETDNWYLPHYLAIDQGPVVVMMENYRGGLLWKLFMSCPEIQTGLKKLGFTSPHIK
jgi:hypothetical protein